MRNGRAGMIEWDRWGTSDDWRFPLAWLGQASGAFVCLLTCFRWWRGGAGRARVGPLRGVG